MERVVEVVILGHCPAIDLTLRSRDYIAALDLPAFQRAGKMHEDLQWHTLLLLLQAVVSSAEGMHFAA